MMAIGPSSVELGRLTEGLRALVRHEPGVMRVILVDDGPPSRDLRLALPAMPDSCRVEIVKSLRDGRGEPLMGGGCAVMLSGLRAAAESDVGDFLLKLDTDALVIRPFADSIGALMAREPQAGIIGACSRSPTGEPRSDAHHRRVFNNAGSWHVPRGQRKSVGRHHRFPSTWDEWRLLRLMRRARRSGCTMGENVSGGAYVITAEALRRMKSARLLETPTLWIKTLATEDGVIPLYARMLGLKLVDFADAGEVFGVTVRGLPCTLEEIAHRRYSIIHSIKNDPRASESDIRRFFAERLNVA